MSETTWARLRRRLLDRYEEFVRRLTRRLGSPDLAREAIHETYLRFERVGDTEPVANLDGYIFQTAVNIAKNRSVVDRRYLSASETAELIGIPDEAPDAARTASARLEMERLTRLLDELPPRRREIFIASWVDGVSYAALAERYGVHIRTIQREVLQATLFVRRRWNENDGPARRNSPPRLSSD